MEKTIEQLLEISKNPYYSLTPEERKRLDDFLWKNSAQKPQPKHSGGSSEKNIPATVVNKNRVEKETGEMPTINKANDIEKNETAAVEEAIHPDAVR
jgi:hypothetical protein